MEQAVNGSFPLSVFFHNPTTYNYSFELQPRLSLHPQSCIPSTVFLSVSLLRFIRIASLQFMTLVQKVSWASSTLQKHTELDELVFGSDINAKNKPWMEIMSGAGHDSCHINKLCPTAMIFIPCVKGSFKIMIL